MRCIACGLDSQHFLGDARMRFCFSLTAAVIVLMAQAASAHFVWVAIEKDSGGQPKVNVWFSELAEPDSADLLDRIAKVKVWSRTASGAGPEISLTKKIEGGGGALVG